jgi:hypothetical protein
VAFGGSFFTAENFFLSLSRKAVLAAVFFFCLSVPAESDVKGSRDHPLFKRPAGYRIVSYFQGDRAAVLPLGNGSISLSGRQTEILYHADGSPLSASALGRRFMASLLSAGGEVLFRESLALGGRRVVGRFVRPRRDVWVIQEILSLREYRLTVFEEGGKRPPLPKYPVPAESLDKEAQVLDLLYSLERKGRLEFPVKFPSRSSVPQKGYEKDFEKFVLLMEKDPSMHFLVETYTDPDLKPAEQRTLLRERTAALLGLLADGGADRSRLTTEAKQPSEPFDSAPAGNDPPRGAVRLTLVKPSEDGSD